MYCSYCGNNIREGLGQCPACGNSMRPPVARAYAGASQESSTPGGITCASVLLYIQGGLAVPVFVGVMIVYFAMWRLAPQEFWASPEAVGVAALCAAVALATLLFTALPFIAAIRLRRGGRTLAVILGVMSLLGFPLGTAFGVLILMGVFDSESADWCARRR